MLMEKEREKVVTYGRKLIETGLTVGTFGNISVFNREQNLMAISPSGLDYFATKPEDVVITDVEGNKVDGDRKPSSELDMHRIFYQKRTDVNAVVHTHSDFSTTLACLQWTIPAIHYLVAYSGREIRCTPYVQFGTYDLAQAALDTMDGDYAVLLGNHGLLTCGGTIDYAMDVAQQVEFLAQVYWRSKCVGEPVMMSDAHITSTLNAFKTYRQA